MSRRLGNESHYDDGDAQQCYAVWVRRCAGVPAERLTWFFLLPDHGVAIQLRDGTLGSWHGALLKHCTLVPSGLLPDDELYSIFMGVYSRVSDAHKRIVQLEAALATAHAEREDHMHVPLEVGETVWMRFYRSDNVWRRATGVVEALTADGMVIRWKTREGGPMRGSATVYSCLLYTSDAADE